MPAPGCSDRWQGRGCEADGSYVGVGRPVAAIKDALKEIELDAGCSRRVSLQLLYNSFARACTASLISEKRPGNISISLVSNMTRHANAAAKLGSRFNCSRRETVVELSAPMRNASSFWVRPRLRRKVRRYDLKQSFHTRCRTPKSAARARYSAPRRSFIRDVENCQHGTSNVARG